MKDLPASARLAMQEKDVEIQEAKRSRKNVRRRLFVDDDNDKKEQNGADTPQEWELEYLEARKKELEEAKKRWNFDFEKEEILPGRYAWVKLDKDGNEINGDLEQDQTTGVENEATKVSDEKESNTSTAEQSQADD